MPTAERVVIVGAGVGLSASLARKCAAQGMEVFLAARDTAKLAGLVVEDKLTGEQVQDFAVGRKRDTPSAFDGDRDVVLADLTHTSAEVEAGRGVDAHDIGAADANHALVDVDPHHALGLVAGRLDRTRCRTKFGDEAFAHSC